MLQSMEPQRVDLATGQQKCLKYLNPKGNLWNSLLAHLLQKKKKIRCRMYTSLSSPTPLAPLDGPTVCVTMPPLAAGIGSR